MIKANLLAGWLGIFCGLISGAVSGLFFHQEDWLGGYNSYSRRLHRLGHVSFFGLGFLNLAFVSTSANLRLESGRLIVSSFCLIAGAVTMPIVCFLSAWRKPFRHLFPIPVATTFIGVGTILIGWIAK